MVTEAGPIKGLVLAAGMSRRLGRPKQLLEVAGKPLIAHVVERCLASALDDVIVVIGHEAAAVRHALTGLDVFFATNPRFADGQASSLVAGIDALSPDTDAVVIALGDQPDIDPQAIDRLVAARRKQGASIGMARYGEDRGHPVLFGRELFDELRGITGDQGGREVIRRHRDQVVLVDGGRSRPPADVDTEEAYAHLLREWAGRKSEG